MYARAIRRYKTTNGYNEMVDITSNGDVDDIDCIKLPAMTSLTYIVTTNKNVASSFSIA